MPKNELDQKKRKKMGRRRKRRRFRETRQNVPTGHSEWPVAQMCRRTEYIIIHGNRRRRAKTLKG